MKRKIYITGEGCNRRQLEATQIRKYLTMNGHTLVDSPRKADLIILTTCAFKEKEEDKSVANIKNMMKYNAEVVIFGCLPDIAPARFEEFQHLRHLAPKDLDRIDSLFEDVDVQYENVPAPSNIQHGHRNVAATVWEKVKSGDMMSREFYRRAKRAAQLQLKSICSTAGSGYLFICRGCKGKCTYCAIRRSIGAVISKPPRMVLEELRAGVEHGQGHFTILGDDPGCYGLDIGTSFPELLDQLIKERPKLILPEKKIRNAEDITFQINEIHPKFMLQYQDPMMEIFDSTAVTGILCPLQSGSDRVLELMQREHKASDYMKMLRKVREKNPHIHLSTQVIAGFPTETEEEFMESVRVVSDVRFDEVVFFPYHQKEHTPAADIDGHVADDVIHARIDKASAMLEKENIKVYTKCPL